MVPKDISLLVLLFIIGCSLSVSGQTRSSKMPDMSYLELIKNKETYIGKPIRLHAIWTYGFEWTYFCDLVCNDIDMASVEIADDEALCNSKGGIRRKLGKKFDNKAEVIVQGRLDGPGGYGHMGAFPYRFVVTCFEKYKKIY
jgi:hypothetical protein